MVLRLIFGFVHWWYGQVPRWFVELSRRCFLFLDRDLAVRLMLRLWMASLFGDPSLIGRFIGLIFRSLRILLGVFLMTAAQLALIFYLLLWLALPFLIFSSLRVLSWLILIISFGLYSYHRLSQAPQRITARLSGREDPTPFLRPITRRFVDRTVVGWSWLTQLLSDRIVAQLWRRLGFSSREELLRDWEGRRATIESVVPNQILRDSLALAIELKDAFIEPYHLFLALSKKSDYHFDDFREILVWQRQSLGWYQAPMIWSDRFSLVGAAGVNRGWTGRVTPNLNKFGLDLTVEAQAGRLPNLIGKQKPLTELLRVLEKGAKNNAILVGQPGCGKTSLVAGLAQEIVTGTRSPALADHRLVSLEIGKLTAGVQTTGDLQERLLAIIREIEGSGNIILFLDEIHNAVTAGGGVDTSIIFGTLEPHLMNRQVQVVGATSWRNYRRFIEPNEAFARLFEIVEVPEADFAETLKILEFLSLQWERRHRVLISFPALAAAVELSAKYVYDRVLPDKAVDLLEETVIGVARGGGKIVRRSQVEKLITEKTNVPLAPADEAESSSLLNLESRMHERLIDQEEAVSAVADALRRARVGLREEKRPIASLLFVGPTGVGKTETARTLAANFFGKEDLMIRFDMSEYQGLESVGPLIERLTDAVRRRPFSLILFDEMEKAHSKILDLFLQVLEDGRLTDANGLTVSFSNAIIVFTSNAGTSLIFSRLREGRRIEEFRRELLAQLEKDFRLELLNRFDGVIVFKPLLSEHVEMIARLKLRQLARTLAAKGINLSFSDNLVKRLAIEGFDSALGARPLRRLIQDRIESVLAKKILSGQIQKDQTVALNEDFLEGGP